MTNVTDCNRTVEIFINGSILCLLKAKCHLINLVFKDRGNKIASLSQLKADQTNKIFWCKFIHYFWQFCAIEADTLMSSSILIYSHSAQSINIQGEWYYAMVIK